MTSMSYYLRKAGLPKGTDKYQGQLIPNGKLTLEDIIQEMLALGSGAAEADIRAIMQLFIQVRLNAVRRGQFWDDGLFNCRMTMRGLFDGPTDHFQDGRNVVHINVIANARLQECLRELHMEKQNPPSSLPEIYSVQPFGARLGAGELAKIEGLFLDFDQSDSSQGLSFESLAEPGTLTAVSRYADSEPRKLSFLLPDSLVAGSYILRFHGSHGNAEFTVTLV